MLTKEMKLTKHYQLHASVFGVDVLMTQSQPIESTRGAHRTPSIPRPPNPIANQGESSTPYKPIVFRIRRRSQPNPETLILTAAEIDIASLDEATQKSIAIERSLVDLKAQQNVKRVEEHLVDAKIKQIVESNDDVDENHFVDEILNSQEDHGTRLELGSHKERPEVKKSVDLMIIDEEDEEESARDALIRRKGKGIVEIKDTLPSTPIRSPRTHSASLSIRKISKN
ncbi:hypothetical protein Tco_1355798 [Tanacetum coccineum]